MIKEVMFNGEIGRMEGKYCHGERSNSPAALILHPHPLHGGTMNNKIVYNVFHIFAQNKFSVLRFNFRGVGKSIGEFDHGKGELIDAATALDWLQSKNPEASSYWIAGFSFGAWIAMQLLMRRPEINGFVSVSPPASTHDFSFLSPCPISGLIVQGTKDVISKEEDVYSLYEKLFRQKKSQVEYKVIEGADHFFKNKIKEMNKSIDDFIAPRLMKQVQPKKIRRDRKRKTL